jgi:hypothetical protein
VRTVPRLAIQRLARSRQPHERHLERELVDVVGVVGRRQHLALVDEVDAERLQHARLGEVADAALGHHGDRDGVHDARDDLGVRHARDAAVAPDVGGNALERHHRHGARVLGDLRLLRVRDVHDHAALEHLGEAGLEGQRSVFFSSIVSLLARRSSRLYRYNKS